MVLQAVTITVLPHRECSYAELAKPTPLRYQFQFHVWRIFIYINYLNYYLFNPLNLWLSKQKLQSQRIQRTGWILEIFHSFQFHSSVFRVWYLKNTLRFGGERKEKRAIARRTHICKGTVRDLEECGLHSSGSAQGPVQDLVMSLKIPCNAQKFSTDCWNLSLFKKGSAPCN